MTATLALWGGGVGLLVMLGLGAWLMGRMDRAKERGRDEVHDELMRGNNDILRRQRDSLANPVTDEHVSEAFGKGEY